VRKRFAVAILSSSLLIAQAKPKQPLDSQKATGTVHVTSRPNGAEISVDGKFYGNAPSDLVLLTGEHLFKVALKGKEWTRPVQITSGHVTVYADLSDEEDSSGSARPSSVMADTSPFGDSQPAADKLRALAQTLRNCPDKSWVVMTHQWGKNPTDTEKIILSAPRDVTWDVTTSSNARSPYTGYLQYLVFSDIDVPQQSMRDWSRAGYMALWLQQKKTIWDQESRFEFDIGPSGLELVRALHRPKGGTEWEVNPSLTLPECPPPGHLCAIGLAWRRAVRCLCQGSSWRRIYLKYLERFAASPMQCSPSLYRISRTRFAQGLRTQRLSIGFLLVRPSEAS